MKRIITWYTQIESLAHDRKTIKTNILKSIFKKQYSLNKTKVLVDDTEQTFEIERVV